MSTKKIQITTPIVTSVNGQTGDVTVDTAVQPDWQQNDETAKDYIRNRPGGYDIVSDFETLYTGTSSAASNESEGVSVNPISNPVKVTNKIKAQDIIKLTIDGTVRQYTLITENLDGSECLTYGTHTLAELSGFEEFPSDFILGALQEVEDTPGYYVGFFFLSANYAEKTITIEHGSVTAIKIPQKYFDIDKEYYIVSLTNLTGKTTYSSNGKARYSGGTLSSNAKDILAAYKQGRVPILLVEFTDLYEDKSLRQFALSCSCVTEVAAHDDISNGINIGFGAIYTDVVNSAYPEFETVYVEIWYDLDGDIQTVETKVTRNNYITYDDIEIPSALSEGQSLICKKGSSGKYKWSRGYPVVDWSQNDPKKAGYVANRPGGYISSAGKAFDPAILTIKASEKYISWLFGYGQNFTFVAGDVFKITLGGIDVEYTVYSIVNDSDNAETLYFGTITPEEMQKIRTNVLNPPDEFFCGYLSAEDDSHFLQCYLSKNHAGQTLKVELLDRLAKIPAKYLDITPFGGSYNDLIDKPTKVSDFENDSGYLTKTDIPDSLKNPNVLTFTGAATGTYDGSEAVTINIPEAGAAGGKLTFTGGATGEYDGSSDVSIEIPNGGASVQADWNQNDSTASDYIKNRPGGYDKQVSINIDKDITADTEGVIATSNGFAILLPEIKSIYELIGAKIGISSDSTQDVSAILDFSSGLPQNLSNEGLLLCYLLDNSRNTTECQVIYSPKENMDISEIDNGTVLNKGWYLIVSKNFTHLYIYNNSVARIPIAGRYLGIQSVSDELKVLESPISLSIAFNCKWGPNMYTYTDNNGQKVIDARIKTYKAGNGISISNNGTISVTTATYYSGTSTPANTLGADGDLYLQTEG